MRRADRKTLSNIASFRRPVWVFRWLGWYDAIRMMGDRDEIAPWRNFGAGVGTACPVDRHALRNAAIATPPSATTTRKFGRSIASRSRYGWHRANSARVGLFPGGAHRTAATM